MSDSTLAHRIGRWAILPAAATLGLGLSTFTASTAEAATYYCNGFKATIVGTSGNNDTVEQRYASDREEDRWEDRYGYDD